MESPTQSDKSFDSTNNDGKAHHADCPYKNTMARHPPRSALQETSRNSPSDLANQATAVPRSTTGVIQNTHSRAMRSLLLRKRGKKEAASNAPNVTKVLQGYETAQQQPGGTRPPSPIMPEQAQPETVYVYSPSRTAPKCNQDTNSELHELKEAPRMQKKKINEEKASDLCPDDGENSETSSTVSSFALPEPAQSRPETVYIYRPCRTDRSSGDDGKPDSLPAEAINSFTATAQESSED